MKKLMESWNNFKKTVPVSHQLLNEATLARVMSKYFDIGFIIISADRSCEAELGRKCSEHEENQQRHINKESEPKIKADIKASGFGYIPTYGGFREKVEDEETGEFYYVDNPNPELSFTIPAQKGDNLEAVDLEKLKQLGMELCQKYDQDSFLFKPPNSKDTSAYFITRTGDVEMKFDNVVANDLKQIYYTQLRKKTGRKTHGDRFSLTENFSVYIPHPPSHPQEARKRRGEIFIRIAKA